MSDLEFVSLDDVGEPAPLPSDVVVDPTVGARRALVEILWRLGEDVGRLRRGGSSPEYLLERLDGHVEDALNIASPSAAELIAAGVEVDVALEVARDRGERIRRLLGLEVES